MSLPLALLTAALFIAGSFASSPALAQGGPSPTHGDASGTAHASSTSALELRLQSRLVDLSESRPGLAAPIAVTAAGGALGLGSLMLGGLRTMGQCSPDHPECNHRVESPFLIAAAVGGAVSLGGGLWTLLTLRARRPYSREMRDIRLQLRALRAMPPRSTAGSAGLMATFTL